MEIWPIYQYFFKGTREGGKSRRPEVVAVILRAIPFEILRGGGMEKK